MKKRKWSAWTCLSWKKQNPAFFHKAFFFSKVFALEHFFLLTHAYLSKQTFIPFYYRVWGSSSEVMPYKHILAVTVTSFLWHNKWLTQPQAALNIGWWFHDGALQMLPMGPFLKGKKHRTVFLCANKNLGPFDPMENVCLLVAAKLESDDLHSETFVSFIIWCSWPTAWLHNK